MTEGFSAAVSIPEGPEPDAAFTPMMAQYLAAKAAHADALVFFRMGDFYEMFFDDAVKAAAALDIALTRRGRHRGEDVPMCGVPVQAAETYLTRLIKKGFRVAICEQMESPAEARKRGGKSLVARDVVRVVTPGTLTEEALLDTRSHNFLVALAEAQGGLALAWLDMSTGDVTAQPVGVATLAAALARVDPGELLVPEPLLGRAGVAEPLRDLKSRLTPLPSARFDSVNGGRRLQDLYGVETLDGFGAFGRAEIAALGALVDYVALTQKGRLPYLAPPRQLAETATMEIDPATRRNLELARTLAGERRGSLLDTIDRTCTGLGARLLAARLSAPLTDAQAIGERLDVVEHFVANPARRQAARGILDQCPDIERALSRLSLGRGGPRDLAALRDGLDLAMRLAAALRLPEKGSLLPDLPPALDDALSRLGHRTALSDLLQRALGPTLPLLARDGGFIAPGYSADLDEFRLLRDEGKRLIAALQDRYAQETGVAGLRVRHNNVIGYFIEVTATHADKLAAQPQGRFIHRQSLAGAVRFTTVELGDLAGRITTAADRALALELDLFADLAAEVCSCAAAVGRAAEALAEIDVAAGLAELAAERRYGYPPVNDGLGFRIEGGRHPVVEAALADRAGAAFVANDCDLSPDQRLWLVTGPNMAGKSTFLRQNALIAILAQMGSFVPATGAEIGIVDRLFSRVGASDDLARGRSTFMVEMVETAAILHQAGPRALVILDEIGRGTATFDGLSIAWATLEHLHAVNRCRALFATHYHELTALAGRLDALKPCTMRVKGWQDDIVFLHEVAPGHADRSYGIHVAKIAGLPQAAVARAEEVLAQLENGSQATALARLGDDLPLFRAPARPASPPKRSAVEAALATIEPDSLSPKEALDLVYRLKGLL
ncbi:MAG: DNA mismatch repair protein MutS [Alphaproteobacteria bacterium]